MRVIAGSARGRRLAGPPPGANTRPTSDKVREALFNILGEGVTDARVVDLFAGTGALGIEALSRGAARVVFVEADRRLCRTVRDNVDTVGLADRAEVLARDVRQVAAALRERGPFDLALVDPPYGLGLEAAALTLLARPGVLAPDAVVVLEHASRREPDVPADALGSLVREQTRTYGDTALTWYRASGETSGPVPAPDPSRDPAPDAPARTAAPHATGVPAMPRTAIYPGSFDPLTNGHHDVIRRSLMLFDRLVVAVAANQRKQPLFTLDERIALIREVVGEDPRVEVDTFEGLLVNYAQRKGAVALVRGLRAVADFEYEFEMASMNRRLAPDVETVFLMTHESYFYVSSHLVKEVAALGGNVDDFVPPAVASKLRDRVAARK